MTDVVRLERHDAVGVVVIDNPPVNALSRQVLGGLAEVVGVLESDASVRAVVLASAGEKAFVAGADITEFPQLLESPDLMSERTAWTRGHFDRLAGLPQPVIAAVQADAVGGGLELTLLCDLVIAEEHARFGVPEVKLGLIPGGGGTQRLPRRIGPLVALEMLATGSLVDANRAERVGLVNRVVPAGQARSEALALASRLADLPAVAVQAAKRAVAEGADLPLGAALDRERQLFLETFASADLREGYQAFLEKRRPSFTHR